MRKSKFRWMAAAAACALLASLGAVPAAAEDEQVDVVEQVKAELVQRLLLAASDDIAQRDLFDALLKEGVVDPATVLAGSRSGAGQEFTRWAAEADRTVTEYMELPRLESSALRVYLADSEEGLGKGQLPLFAVAPSNEENDSTTLTAFDLAGREVVLDLREAPRYPVIFADLNLGAIMDGAVWSVSAALNANGVLSDVLQPADPPPHSPTTRLDKIKIKDVQEWGAGAWWCPGSICDAEVVAFAMGGSGGLPRVDVIALGEVNEPNTTYNVMRNIINWGNFSWTNVDFLIMEMDATPCSATWAKYGQVISDGVKTLAATPVYTPLIPAARSALNDKKKICSWWNYFLVNLPDHIDSYFALSQFSVGSLSGTSSNATGTFTLVP